MSVHEGKRIQDMSIVERLRNALQPKGTAPIVILRPLGIGIEMHADFVSKCIDELEQMPIRAAMGEPPTNLEKLAYQLLLDSAYIDPKQELEREEFLKKEGLIG
jgi:hypothetical protein